MEDISGPRVFFMQKAEKFAQAVLDLELHHMALKLKVFVITGLGKIF